MRRLARRGDVDGLVLALDRRDRLVDGEGRVVDLAAGVRVEAVHALGLVGDPRSVEGLIRVGLLDEVDAVRAEVVRALERHRDPEVVAALVEGAACWPAPYPRSRGAALEVIAGYGYSSAAVDFVGYLLSRPLEPDEDDEQCVRFLVGGAPGSETAEAIAVLLAETLENGSEDEADRAAAMLPWLGHAGVPATVAVLRSAPVAARRRAALALGRLGDSDALDPLVAALESADPDLRLAAVRALGELRDPRAVAPLMRASHDEAYSVRTEASTALDDLGTVAVIVGIASALYPMLPEGQDRAREPRLFRDGTARLLDAFWRTEPSRARPREVGARTAVPPKGPSRTENGHGAAPARTGADG